MTNRDRSVKETNPSGSEGATQDEEGIPDPFGENSGDSREEHWSRSAWEMVVVVFGLVAGAMDC